MPRPVGTQEPMEPPPMPSSNDETSFGNHLWRIEQRQLEILSRIEKVLAKVEEEAARRDASLWRIETKLSDLEHKATAPAPSGFFGNPEIVKIVVYGLLALVAALAAGQAFVFGG